MNASQVFKLCLFTFILVQLIDTKANSTKRTKADVHSVIISNVW